MENLEERTPLLDQLSKSTSQDSCSTPGNHRSSSTNWFLHFAATVANLISFTTGIALAWSSPVLPKMTGTTDPTINPIGRIITTSEESWIAGIVCLGGIFGPFAGPLADKIGRKKTLFLISCPMILSFLLSAFAKTVELLYICRFIVGISAGSTYTVLPIYLTEIGEDHNRGTLGCSLTIFTSSGMLFAFLVGPFLTIRDFCLVCAVPLLIFIPVFAIWIPETPYYLAYINKNKELEDSLSKLRKKTNPEIQKEAGVIIKSVLEKSKDKGRIIDLFTSTGTRKALIITLGLVFVQQFSGICPVFAYMQSIFQETGSGLAPEISTIIIGIIRVASSIAASSLVDRLGRRFLLLASSCGSCVALVCLGLYFFLKLKGINIEMLSWLPVSSLVLYTVAFNVGIGPVPYAMMAELFPSKLKFFAACLTNITGFGLAFLITVLFPIFVVMLGMAGSFWIFALVCFISVIFIFRVVPETKSKSLQEIQNLLEENKRQK